MSSEDKLIYNPVSNKMVRESKRLILKEFMDRWPGIGGNVKVGSLSKIDGLGLLREVKAVACSRCGVKCEWDEALGGEPLCLKCWDDACDKYIESMVAILRHCWYERNKEKVLAWCKAYYERNKEKVLARDKVYRECNKEKIAARVNEHYKCNRALYLERQRIYYLSHKDKVSARTKAYYERNKEKILAWCKAHYERNKEKVAVNVR